MRLRDAIDRADNEKPNQFTEEQKIEWLSALDFNVFNNIILTHEPMPERIFEGYTADDIDNALIAKAPYDEMYVAFLKMKYDEMNEETARYNNSATIFNTHYTNFEKFYHKVFKSVDTAKFRIWGR